MTIQYTGGHEWIAVEGDTATVGITQHAMGDHVRRTGVRHMRGDLNGERRVPCCANAAEKPQ